MCVQYETTVIHAAAQNGYLDVVKLLLAAGAIATAQNNASFILFYMYLYLNIISRALLLIRYYYDVFYDCVYRKGILLFTRLPTEAISI